MRCSILILFCVVMLPGCGAVGAAVLGVHCAFEGSDSWLCKPGTPGPLVIENAMNVVWTSGTIRAVPEGDALPMSLPTPIAPGASVDVGAYAPGHYEVDLSGYEADTMVPRTYRGEWSGALMVVDAGA